MGKRIKILEAIRQGKIGGGETHVLELTTQLDKNIFEPVILSFTPGPMVDELNRRGIETRIINTEKPFDFRVWKQVLRLIRTEGIDIVHAHGTRAASNVFLGAKQTGVPLVYTVHGWSFHPDQTYLERQFRELSEKFLTSMADRTICVSKSNQSEGIKRFGMKRSEVIYNAVNLEKFNPSRQFKDIRNELGIAKDKTVIGYIVRITNQKDPFTMIYAMKKLLSDTKDVILLVVGDGDLKEAMVKLVRDLQIENNIVFQPFRTDIPDILNAIDIYCLPSLWEGFPIGILESMAMKKPVIATPVDGTSELIEYGETGFLVPVSSPDLLASKLLQLHLNQNLSRRLAMNGYEFISRRFSIQSQVKQVEHVYETMKKN